MRRAPFFFLLFLFACAGPSLKQAVDLRLNETEFAVLMPEGRREDISKYLQAHPNVLYSEAYCIKISDKEKRCAPYICGLEKELVCRWKENNVEIRADLAKLAGEDGPESTSLLLGLDPSEALFLPGKFKSEQEAKCKRNIFFEDRASCIDAYFSFLKENSKKAQSLLDMACKRKGSFCIVNGKKIGTWKKKPTSGRSVSNSLHIDGEISSQSYEYFEVP